MSQKGSEGYVTPPPPNTQIPSFPQMQPIKILRLPACLKQSNDQIKKIFGLNITLTLEPWGRGFNLLSGGKYSFYGRRGRLNIGGDSND